MPREISEMTRLFVNQDREIGRISLGRQIKRFRPEILIKQAIQRRKGSVLPERTLVTLRIDRTGEIVSHRVRSSQRSLVV